MVCSTNDALESEIKLLKTVFTKTNGYPSKIVENTLQEVRSVLQRSTTEDLVEPREEQIPEENDEVVAESKPYICLPYKGEDGEK